jgi:hypothetical protein
VQNGSENFIMRSPSSGTSVSSPRLLGWLQVSLPI